MAANEQDVKDVRLDIKTIRGDQRTTLLAVLVQLVGALAFVLWWVITHPAAVGAHL